MYNTQNGHFFPMDVVNDTLAYRYGNTIYGEFEGVRIQKKKRLIFPGECGLGHFDYKIKKNKLYLKSDLSDTFEGYKCDSTCCDLVEEYTINFLVDIDFSILNKETKSLAVNQLDRYSTKSIIIGKPKKKYLAQYGDSIRIEISGNLFSLQDINDWAADKKNNYRKGYFQRLSFEIIADKNVPTYFVKAVVNELHESGARKILLTYLKENVDGKMTIEYVWYHLMKWPIPKGN